MDLGLEAIASQIWFNIALVWSLGDQEDFPWKTHSCERPEITNLAQLNMQPRATWHSLPSELHLAIHRKLGYKITYESIPGSRKPDNVLPALYSAITANSQLQGVNRSICSHL
jgi:hypothetical protein